MSQFMTIKNIHLPFLLLTLAAFIFLIVGRLVCDNMFIDGVLYNSVAHNLAHGRGTFWFPHFAKNTMSFFHEQPPLTFFIESLFFRISDTPWTERVYSAFTFCVCAWLIAAIWRSVAAPELRAFAYLPVLSLLAIPCANYAFSNCLEENTMSMFVLASVWLQLQVVFHQKKELYSALAAIALLLAALSKGFPGLFPLVFYGVAWLLGFRSFSVLARHFFIVIGVFSLGVAALALYPPSQESLGTYIAARVVNSINHVACQGTRTWIFSHLCSNIKVQALLTLAALIWAAKQRLDDKIPFKTAQLFLILAFLGTLPLMVTREQRGQYLVTAMPFFALTFSTLIAPVLHDLLSKLSEKALKITTIFAVILLLIAIGYTINRVGKTYDLHEKVHDFHILEQKIPPYAEVGIPSQLWNDWDLQTALNRSRFIDLNGNPADTTLPYFITQKDSTFHIPTGYKSQNLDTKYYILYKK